MAHSYVTSEAKLPASTGTHTVLSTMQSFLLKGYEFDGPMGWGILGFITALPGVGQLGMNHVLLGQPVVAIMKSLSLIVSYFLMVLLSPYLPMFLQGQWLYILAGLGPWYIFDIIQSLIGFDIGYFSMIDLPQIPLGGPGGKVPGGKQGKWNLTASNMNILFASITALGQLIPNIFGSSASKFGNFVSYAGAGLLGLSGIGSAAAVLGASPLGAAAMAASAPMVAVGGGGGDPPTLPPLSEILNKIPKQDGGSAPITKKSESKLFLQGLAFVSIAGIALGVIRAKQRPRIPTIG